MMLLLALSLPAAAAPDRVASSVSVGTSIPELVISEDEEWVAFVDDGASQLYVLDTGSWEITGFEVCSSGIAGAAFLIDDATRLFAACEDGTVGQLDHETSAGWSISETTFDVGEEEGIGIFEANGILYVLGITDSILYTHSLDPDSSTLDGQTGYPVSYFYDSFTDLAGDSTAMYVLHSSDNVSKLTLSGGGLVNRETGVGGDGQDLEVVSSTALLAGGSSGILRYSAENDILILLNTSDMDSISALSAIDSNTALLLADSGQSSFLIYDYDSAAISISTELTDSFSYDAKGSPVEMVSMVGYTVAGTDAGELLYLTDRPWVITDSFSSSTVAVGDTVEVTFTSDTDGDWELRDGEDGDVLDSGELLADESVTASFEVTDGLFDEGDNELWIAVIDSSGLEGHDAVTVSIDNPPDQVQLSEEDIGFGDGTILLSFDGVDDSDLSHYEVFLSVAEFTGDEDWDAGEHSFWGDVSSDTGLYSSITELTVPIEHEADPSSAVEITIEGVTNDVTYYLAVRAVDTGGLEGDMSDVFSVTPQETYSASELAGETGGFCGTPWPASLALALIGGMAAVSRRRYGLAALGLLALSVPAEALADDMPGAKERKPLMARSSSITFGAAELTDANLAAAYGSSSLSLWGTTGFSLRHIAEIEAGIGVLRDKGTTLTDSYSASSEDTKLTAIPLTLSATLRLDAFENQILVPFVSVGGDYWLWRESWAQDFEVLSSDAIGGGKYGWHWAAGGQFLLDIFEPRQASLLFAKTGIQDSYITVEYRENTIGEWQQSDGNGLLFDSRMLHFGLRFDR